MENGVLRMHRTIDSENVEGYASHLPPGEVDMTKEEDIVYKNGVLSHASGSTSVKLLEEVCVLFFLQRNSETLFLITCSLRIALIQKMMWRTIA